MSVHTCPAVSTVTVQQGFVASSRLKRLRNTLFSAGVVGVVIGCERTSLKDTREGESAAVSMCCLHPDSRCFVRLRALTSLAQPSLVHSTQRLPRRSVKADDGGLMLASSSCWVKRQGHEMPAVTCVVVRMHVIIL